MKNFNREKQTRFSLRKMSIGVCSVAIGLFFAGQRQQNTVEAATVQTPAVQVNTQQTSNSTTSQPEISKNSTAVVEAPKNQTVQSAQKVSNTTKTEATPASKQAVTNATPATKTTENSNTVDAKIPNNQNVKSPVTSKASQQINTQPTPIHKNQWVNENGSTYYYYNNGQKIVDQWHNFSTGTFYLSNNGHTVKNQWYTMPTKQTYYFDNNGQTVRNKWFTFPSKQTYYFDNDGHTVKNRWYTMPTKQTYYFDNSGHTVRNKWFTFPSKQTYYFDNNGHTVKNRWYNFSSGTYYLGSDGHTVKNQWYTMPTGKTYYFTNNGHTVKNQWYTFAGNQTYYFNNDGHTVKNEWFTMPAGQTYYFDNNGHTVRNRWYTLPSKHTYYFDNNGHTVRNRFYALNGETYYFNENGVKQNDNLVEQWKKILNGFNGHHVMIAVQSQKDGSVHEYTNSPGYRLPMASTVKVAVLSQLLHNTNGNLNDYQKNLASKMIRNSDNNATTTLINSYLGGTKGMQAIYSALGMNQTTPGANNYWGLTKTTATDQLKLLNEIFIKPHSSYLNDKSRNYIKSLMGSVSAGQNWGVSAGSKDFYLKNGWLALSPSWTWYVNSIGYIPRGNNSYTIAVYSDNNLPMSVGVNKVEALARATRNINF